MVTKFDHNLVMSENVEFVIVSCQWSVVGCQWSVVNQWSVAKEYFSPLLPVP